MTHTSSTEPTDRFRWLAWIDRFTMGLAILGGVAAAALMVNVIVDVIGRALLHRPLPFTLDFTQFLWMPVLIAFGLGFALQRGEHIRVSLLTAPTTSRTQRIVEIVSMAFTLGTLIPLTYFAASRAIKGAEVGEAAVGTAWLLIWPIRLAVALGLIGLILQAFAQLVRACTVKVFVADDDEVAGAIEQEQSVLTDLISVVNTSHAKPQEASKR